MLLPGNEVLRFLRKTQPQDELLKISRAKIDGHIRKQTSSPELADEANMGGVCCASAIAISADDAERYAGVEAVGKAEAKTDWR